MTTTVVERATRSLAIIATALVLAACGNDSPVAPEVKDVDMRGCENLNVPAAAMLANRLFARGVQIYRWNGSTWGFVEPSAVLFADAQANEAVGIHFAGPTWEGLAGSKVVGSVVERCTPNANAIPWLLLGATSAEGAGVFQRTTYVQRVNTVGGLAPTVPGSVVGELANVPYTAEYFFYRAQ
jgi:hypothetical protein